MSRTVDPVSGMLADQTFRRFELEGPAADTDADAAVRSKLGAPPASLIRAARGASWLL
jgi:hypothetical protein